jgi:hypothetical protein
VMGGGGVMCCSLLLLALAGGVRGDPPHRTISIRPHFAPSEDNMSNQTLGWGGW